MKIAVLQGSSQRDKNEQLYSCTKKAVQGHADEVINFGVFPEEKISFSYVQTALCISMLIGSGTVDFAVTGCSSGQGMMLACNSLPVVLKVIVVIAAFGALAAFFLTPPRKQNRAVV